MFALVVGRDRTAVRQHVRNAGDGRGRRFNDGEAVKEAMGGPLVLQEVAEARRCGASSVRAGDHCTGTGQTTWGRWCGERGPVKLMILAQRISARTSRNLSARDCRMYR